MELVLLKTDSPEWDFIWNWLANHPLNKGLDEPTTALNENEAWQYMGSYKQKERVLHSFRHRNHPVTNSVQNVSVQCSEAFTIDQIHRTDKL